MSDSMNLTSFYDSLRSSVPLSDADSVRTLGWGSRESQRRRFAALLKEAPMTTARSVLDVGCGYGDLAGCMGDLTSTLTTLEYTGIDARPEAIFIARQRQPAGNFFVSDLYSWTKRSDVVLASGLLGHVDLGTDVGESILRATLAHLFSLCRLAAGFNCLSAHAEAGPRRASPEALLCAALAVTDKIVFRSDYARNDAMVMMYKERGEGR